ncbi:MAG: cytochrome b N-terminal domain-containing protein [Nitrospirae bacterium]|nr:cytochrome b N-terminal domain-containing protein [Nitrospirota bacterium]MCL5423009.1 cytochrome b N-terminal domain-containing protein [Nitrospirota bacterium]
MLTKIKQWMDERWPLSPLIHLALEEEIPGGARYAYTLGSAVLIVFMLQILSGIMQLFFYVPATDHAYNSISYLRTQVPFGWLIHGIHFWGAQLMVILVLLHMARVFLWGAYKKPRELTWIAGVTLFLTTMGFSFTGGPLHWDQRGYWVGDVSTSIAGTVPLVGDLTKQLLRGGEEMGQLALSRLFVIHTAVLPGALLALFVIHIIAMRRFGSVGPWDEEARMKKDPFWPDQVFKDAVAGTTVFLLLILLVVFLPPQYSGMADPLDVSYIPKPEWNFLFLYEALKYFPGKLEPVGTVGVPTVLILILVLLPFIDRNPERNPLKRPIAMICAFILAALVIGISIIGYLSPGFAEAPAKPAATSQKGLSPVASLKDTFSVRTSEAARPSPAKAASVPVTAQGSKTTPDAAQDRGMPGKAAYIIGSAERGAEVFKKNCSSCHGPEGVTNVPNPGSQEGKVPNLSPIERELFSADAQTFAENIDRYIQRGSVPAGPNPAIRMPAFGDANTLTQQEIANVEAYILQLNGVDRAQLQNPGMQPRSFFLLVVVVYGVIILVLGGLWNKRSKQA